jgi:hypothetical protein
MRVYFLPQISILSSFLFATNFFSSSHWTAEKTFKSGPFSVGPLGGCAAGAGAFLGSSTGGGWGDGDFLPVGKNICSL